MKASHLLLFGACLASPAFAQHEEHTAPQAAAPAVQQADPHAGHDMSTMTERTGSGTTAMPPPEAFSGPQHAADLLFDSGDMAAAREGLRVENGDFRALWLMADQLELRREDGENRYAWDVQGWYGGDINKFWAKSEGVKSPGETEHAEVQMLWSRAIHPWFDFQAGMRRDFRPGPERTYLVLGVQGLMPYRFEVDAAAFVSDEGEFSARLEGEYDLWLTQRTILQPRMEINVSAEDVPELAVGSGLSSMELGLRLRHQIRREFSPYLGVEYERVFGGTADYARRAAREVSGWSVVAGLQAWF